MKNLTNVLNAEYLQFTTVVMEEISKVLRVTVSEDERFMELKVVKKTDGLMSYADDCIILSHP